MTTTQDAAAAAQQPALLSQLTTKGSILGIVCSSTHLFAGALKTIQAWDVETLELSAVLRGHEGYILALETAQEDDWLFSSSGDNTVRIWSLSTFECQYLVQPPHDNVGDIFTLAWSKDHHALFLGSQNCSLSWIVPPRANTSSPTSHPVALPRYHRFFDSMSATSRAIGTPLSGTPLSRMTSRSSSQDRLAGSPTRRTKYDGPILDVDQDESASHAEYLEMSAEAVQPYAHVGYVYSICMGKRGDSSILVSASGDGECKIWSIERGAQAEGGLSLNLLKTLAGEEDEAVMCVVASDSTIFAGFQGGTIRIYDVETFQCIRTLKAHTADVLALSRASGELISCAADGTVKRWSRSFSVLTSWQAHDGIVLASNTRRKDGYGQTTLFTGGSDNIVKLWSIVSEEQGNQVPSCDGLQGVMFQLLSQFVTYKSVSRSANREDCRQAASFLKRTLRTLGAEVSLLPGAEGRNPLVLAIFRANKLNVQPHKRKRVLYYGHYDVVEADAAHQWQHDPFSMNGKDGFIYGRGVNDNKGPTLAVACAASTLLESQSLEVDVVLLVEGEEEQNSAGLREAVIANRSAIGEIDVILVSNASWLTENIPAILCGLRGVIHARVTVQANFTELHSGLSGGVVCEPLVDLTRTLASCLDVNGKIAIPGFAQDIKELDEAEEQMYDHVLRRTGQLKTESHIDDARQTLLARWREPSYSCHSIDVSSKHRTVIPSRATANISIRIVPNQSLPTIEAALLAHLKDSFANLQSKNSIEVEIRQDSDWWLSNPSSRYNQAMMGIVQDEWKLRPLFTREGGSVPSVPWLEKEFGASAVHLPLAQASSSAHLANERIRILNLEKGRNIFQRFFSSIADL